MDYIVKLAIVLLMFIYTWFFQVQNQEWDLIRALLKDANNMAVHDAVLELNQYELSNGKIVIDPDEAYDTFVETLERNLGLSNDLAPKSGSRLHSKVKIVDFIIIDDMSNVNFPFLYENSQYHITKYLNGPAVIAIIETEHPKLISRNKKQAPIRVPAIQEYKK
ncbi:hypothetical protein [Paenibacillus tepidiphilus]|uniref:hypothetical protein n=1 Tax=Paenibacillus tepidiphilus TaxID=2608683 RepID=UPI00123B47FF|nr:hypothetical protein [Paenibacillus tepidiphilus]